VQRLALACVLLLLNPIGHRADGRSIHPGGAGSAARLCLPMHPGVRSAGAGKCPRCGMSLALGIPDPVEYPSATRPDGSIEPLLWLYNYQPRFPHTYWY
jgi:hypothetical protein